MTGLADREAAYLDARDRAEVAAERWLDAKAAGAVPAELEREVNEAQRALGRARSALDRARRRSRREA